MEFPSGLGLERDLTYELAGFVSVDSVSFADEVFGTLVIVCACAEYPLSLPDVGVALPTDRFIHHDVTVTGRLIVAFVLSIKMHQLIKYKFNLVYRLHWSQIQNHF